MIRKYKMTLIITAIVTLLPMLLGIVMWNQLPDTMPSHWNAAGEIDGWLQKPVMVFGMPLFLLAIQWVCIAATFADPKKDNHSDKVLHLVLWVTPALSVILFAFAYAVALGSDIRIELIMPVFLGLLFAIIGNYLPKCKRNYTIGIKLPWTLDSEENWNRTHRLAGRLWMACGIVIMASGFLIGFWATMAMLILMVLVPVVFSYLLYRKGV